VDRPVFDCPELERRPALAAQQPPRDRLEVALVGVFEDKDAARPNDPAELNQNRARVAEMVQNVARAAAMWTSDESSRTTSS
jgi:hypothetical protein